MKHCSRQGKSLYSHSFKIGAFLLVLFATTYTLTAFTLLCGGTVCACIFLCAILLSAAMVWCVSREKSTLYDISVALGIVAIALLWCAFMEDASWDGNVYHQKMVAMFLYGWNPYHTTGEEWLQYYDPWVWHYAKCMEMTAAAVASTTGYIEAGKSVNYMLIFSAVFFVYDLLGNTGLSLSFKRKFWIAMIAVANPIGVAQSVTYYNDFAKYYYLLITIAVAVSLCRNKSSVTGWIWYCVLFMVVVLAIGTKFTAFFEQGVAVAAFMIWLMWRRDWLLFKRVFSVAVVALILGSVLLGYHPYVTNFISAGHPLYPLLGEGAIDIMTDITPEVYIGNGRVYNFLYSLFTPKIPYYAEFVGGFGALMPVMLAVAVFVGVHMRRVIPMAVYYIAVWIIMSCFFYEQSWWARYICQLWLLVPLAAFATCYAPIQLSRWVRAVLVAFVLITVAGVGFRAFKGSATLTLRRQMLYRFAQSDGACVANLTLECRRHFEERGINVREIAVNELGDSSLIFFGDKSPWVYPIVDVTPQQYDEFAIRCRFFGMHPEKHLGKEFVFNEIP